MWTLSGFSDEISPEFEEHAPYIRIFLFFILGRIRSRQPP